MIGLHLTRLFAFGLFGLFLECKASPFYLRVFNVFTSIRRHKLTSRCNRGHTRNIFKPFTIYQNALTYVAVEQSQIKHILKACCRQAGR